MRMSFRASAAGRGRRFLLVGRRCGPLAANSWDLPRCLRMRSDTVPID